MTTGFTGMRGTGDWATDERPKNWRQGILYLYPNGMAPLTGLMSKMSDESTDDPEFNWWTKLLATQGGAITGAYTDAGLSVAYVSGGTAGQTLYMKCAEVVASEFRVGHQALLRDADHLDVDVNAKVVAVVKNGASSYLACRLLEADDNGASTDLSDCDTVKIIGNINPEGGPMPDSIAYDPTKLTNKCQIFRTPLSITRTARKTKLRTEDAYKEAKREAMQYHSLEMEMAFFWGIQSENIGSNGKPERTTDGLIQCIKANAATNVNDFSLNTTYSGNTWLASGEEWLDIMLEQIFRYGSMEKLAFVGSGCLLGINRLAKATGQIQLTPMTMAYGLKVMEWITPFGVVYLKTHPLFSYDATTRNAMVIFEPSELKYRYVDDTMFIADKDNSGVNRVDGTNEEWLTECGLEYHHPLKFGYLTGFNTNSVV